ncbi:hypothetical protein E2542_SST11001 [Spatholobus suberectus]|nr:hypothetical protein E2542_SST11001 [Spatholobus suberectus]
MSHRQGIPLHNPKSRIRSSHPPLDPTGIFCPLPPERRHHPVCRRPVKPLRPKRCRRLHRHRLFGRQVRQGGTKVLETQGACLGRSKTENMPRPNEVNKTEKRTLESSLLAAK